MTARKDHFELARILLPLAVLALAFVMTGCHGLHHFSYYGGSHHHHHGHHHHHHDGPHRGDGRRFHR